jgi:hypothetical protein
MIWRIDLENDIDSVFQEFRPSSGLGFGDLANENKDEVSLLSKSSKDVAALSNLGRAAG